jgi:hypothetical protein
VNGRGLHHRAHLVGRQRKDDDVRLTGLMPGLAVAVLLDLARGGRAAIAEARAEIANEPGARVSGED